MPDSEHKFHVGQIVSMVRGFDFTHVKKDVEILKLLPADNKALQYRIKSKTELHERIVKESDLEQVPHG